MSKITYTPTSHFFTDPEKLVIPTENDSNLATDAFGPVKDSDHPDYEMTRYRTTSFVRALDPIAKVPVYAICGGLLLIQASEEANKVNLILKPTDSIYAPLKIKYFVYRGVNKEDLIDVQSNIKAIGANEPNPLAFLKKLWKNEKRTVLPASELGYNSTETSLHDVFNSTSFQIPTCSLGEHIGNFSESIGLDIVIDRGDFRLDNEADWFTFDLTYARKTNHVFDIAILPTEVQKKNKEYIHLFLDAAAFWGSHCDCGTIFLKDKENKKTAEEIYTTVVDKYYTRNKIYLYIQAERGRSYNFYKNYPTGKLYFTPEPAPSQPILPRNYETNGWPIIIEKFEKNGSFPITKLSFGLEFNFPFFDKTNKFSAVPKPERNVSLYACVPGWTTDNFILNSQLMYGKYTDEGITSVVPLSIKNRINQSQPSDSAPIVNSSASIASFLFFSYLGVQELSYKNYFNDLWKVNVKPNVNLPSDFENLCHWVNIFENKLANVSQTTKFNNTLMQQKVVFDNGENVFQIRKQRRLYISSILDTYGDDHRRFITKGSKSAFAILTQENYANSIYDNPDFHVFKGSITDDGDVIPTLSLVNKSNFELVLSYFQLGITEDEYNLLMNNQQIADATNITFHLEEIRQDNLDPAIDVIRDYRKYKLGLHYEDKTGAIQSPLFPTERQVIIYTVDDHYFFSREYVNFQKFYEKFSKTMVRFRPNSKSEDPTLQYAGEFGFDWLRNGEDDEESYQTIIETGYEPNSIYDINDPLHLLYEKELGRNHSLEAARTLKKQYHRIQTQVQNLFYYVPWLNVFPETWKPPKPKETNELNPLPPSTIVLQVRASIDDSAQKVEMKYSKKFFTIDKDVLFDRSIDPQQTEINVLLTITCIKGFSQDQQITVCVHSKEADGKLQIQLGGGVIVQKNNPEFIRVQPIVLVVVRTQLHTSETVNTASILEEEITILRNMLYQSMVYGVIETHDHIFDLSQDSNYKYGGLFVTKDQETIQNEDGTSSSKDRFSLNGTEQMFNLTLAKFLNSPSDTTIIHNASRPDYSARYQGYVVAFLINEIPMIDNEVGAAAGVAKVGEKNPYVFYKIHPVNTLAHEVLHSLGLDHTHINKVGNPPTTNQLFVFPLFTTDNIMAYTAVKTRITWKWQWEIVRTNVK